MSQVLDGVHLPEQVRLVAWEDQNDDYKIKSAVNSILLSRGDPGIM